jgi:hypothetical protein
MIKERKKIRILMISGEDGETDPEIKAVKGALAKHCSGWAEVLTRQVEKMGDIMAGAEESEADIIHFCGYCDPGGYFYLVHSQQVQWDPRFKKESLIRQMACLPHYPRILYFNGHLKERELEAADKGHVDFWIGMETKSHPEVSRQFAPKLYTFLCQGYTFSAAFKEADDLLPKKHARPIFRFLRGTVDPEKYRLCDSVLAEIMVQNRAGNKSRVSYR